MRRTRWGKYGNEPTLIDGLRFDSKREARRYQELRLMAQAGVITELCAEKKALRYPCVVHGQLICTYVADFRYREQGAIIVEDAKGHRTPLYVLKRKLVAALYGIEIREV